jgi:hypothetical protein
VSREVLDVLQLSAASERDREAGMLWVVQTDRGETRALEERLEVPVDNVLGVERSTFPGREYEP